MIDYRIDTDEDAGIVICSAKGELNVENALKLSVANSKAFELNFRIIYDLSQTELSATISDAYHFPRNKTALFGDSNRVPAKIAIVFPKDKNPDFWRFYETTARNAGLPLRVFDSINGARDWCIK